MGKIINLNSKSRVLKFGDRKKRIQKRTDRINKAIEGLEARKRKLFDK